MRNLQEIMSAIEAGDPQATEQLLPVVYGELRALAQERLAHEKPGHTLDATGLVHEAYIRLRGDSPEITWENRAHFFSAAAEAMRRILIESARRRKAMKRGGGEDRTRRDLLEIAAPARPRDVLDLDEALQKLALVHPEKAELVTLRYFGGMSLEEAGKILNISHNTADRHWAYARAWLHQEITGNFQHPTGQL